MRNGSRRSFWTGTIPPGGKAAALRGRECTVTRDVPGRGSGFASGHWIKETLAYTKSLMDSTEGRIADKPGTFREESFLALLLSIHAAGRGKTVRVVDFGGGMGNAYLHFRNNSVIGSNVEYHIVENGAVCDAGRDLLPDEPRVHFHSSLPVGLKGVDIVYICSALQYIEDYPGLLKALCAYRPKYFLFVKLSRRRHPHVRHGAEEPAGHRPSVLVRKFGGDPAVNGGERIPVDIPVPDGPGVRPGKLPCGIQAGQGVQPAVRGGIR